MRSCAVKFAILAAHPLGLEKPAPSDFLELSPVEAVQRYKALLSEEERGALMFGFSDKAITDILDEEFEIDLEHEALVFRKPYLDARSIRLAGGGRASAEIDSLTEKEQALLESLALWLLDATRSLYRGDMGEARTRDILREYEENVGVYVRKCVTAYDPGAAEVFLRSLFASVKAMRAFCHSLTADALFKADAARVLFGESSAYYQAWFRKQVFRHMMCKAVDQYINSCAV